MAMRGGVVLLMEDSFPRTDRRETGAVAGDAVAARQRTLPSIINPSGKASIIRRFGSLFRFWQAGGSCPPLAKKQRFTAARTAAASGSPAVLAVRAARRSPGP